jgi:hypothetical protein
MKHNKTTKLIEKEKRVTGDGHPRVARNVWSAAGMNASQGA